MELARLEDFLEIVATRNFSTAAAARNISQPAFSRRIRSLENWVGADLRPQHLSGASHQRREHVRTAMPELVRDMYRLRTDCRNVAGASSQLLTFTAFHTLAIYFFPDWISRCRAQILRFAAACIPPISWNASNICHQANAISRSSMIIPMARRFSKPVHLNPCRSARIA